jgi:hypothetical protein
MYTKIEGCQHVGSQWRFVMIVEMRTYSLKSGSLGEWLRLYEERGLPVHKQILGNLIGYFNTEIGDINEVIHMWGFDSFEDRQRRRGILSQNADWRDFLSLALPLIQTQQIKLLNCATFSPIR